jgi:hypothetical protein
MEGDVTDSEEEEEEDEEGKSEDDDEEDISEDGVDEEQTDDDEARHQRMLADVMAAASGRPRRKAAAVINEVYPESEYNLPPAQAPGGASWPFESQVTLLMKIRSRGMLGHEAAQYCTSCIPCHVQLPSINVTCNIMKGTPLGWSFSPCLSS